MERLFGEDKVKRTNNFSASCNGPEKLDTYEREK